MKFRAQGQVGVPWHGHARRQRRGRGFTLRDMLVAVTIIVVLLAILIPSVAKARESARRAACLSNQRQLVLSLRGFANDHNGRPFSYSPPSDYWAPAFIAYSTAGDRSNSVLKNVLCPSGSAPTSATNGVGDALTAWGPNPSPAPSWEGLNIPGTNPGRQTGSYTYNGNVYSSGIPGTVPSLIGGNPPGPFGIEVAYIDMTGNPNITGSLLAANGGSIGGASDVTGSIYYVTNPINGAPSATQVTPDGQLPPDVNAIYDTLASDPSKQVITDLSNLDFTNHAVLEYFGNASFPSGNNKVTVTGSGTLLISGNLANLPKGTYSFNIVCRGAFSSPGSVANVNFIGGLYFTGDVKSTGSGQGYLTGILVANGSYRDGGNFRITAAAPPSFDTVTGRGGYAPTILIGDNETDVPVFGDGIWAQAWPTTGDWGKLQADVAARKVSAKTGDMNTQMGRFYIDRHGGVTNMGFLDGSARSVKLGEMGQLRWYHRK